MMEANKTRAVWPEIPSSEQWLPYLQEAIDVNWHTNSGPVSKRFEQRLKSLYGHQAETVITTCSATAALSACLIAHRVSGPVLCPAFTFQATACAILGAGCTPVIVDVDKGSGVVAHGTLKSALIETSANAAMLVAPYGIEYDFSEHAQICSDLGVRLILDNAAGLGIDRRGSSSQFFGDHVDEVFSLHATKPFGIGEGGVVFTSQNHEVAFRSATNFGLQTHTATGVTAKPHWGINGKLSENMAAVGLAVADTMAERVEQRQTMTQGWIEGLGDFASLAFCKDIFKSPWQVFPIFLKDDASVVRFAADMQHTGIEVRRYYQPSLGDCHGMAQFAPCPNAHDLTQCAVVLPVRSYMPAPEQAKLVETAYKCLRSIS